MNFEWDERKRLANLKKHKLYFARATAVFDGRAVLTYHSPRAGEDRWATIGDVDGDVYVVVWAWREPNRCLISARRASKRDERKIS